MQYGAGYSSTRFSAWNFPAQSTFESRLNAIVEWPSVGLTPTDVGSESKLLLCQSERLWGCCYAKYGKYSALDPFQALLSLSWVGAGREFTHGRARIPISSPGMLL